VLVRTAVIAVIALVAIVVLAPALGLWRSGSPNNTVLAAETNTSVNGITVEGMGRVTISPDLATITVAVQAQATTAAEAQAKASASMTKVIAAVKGQGVADADIATQWISLEPQYDYKSDGSSAPKLTGYLASQSLSVKVRAIANVGPIIDSAVAGGANQVSGISFSLADPSGAATQARSAAIANAKARATELAQAAGVSLGAAVSIVELSAPNPIPYQYERAAQAADGATPVQPGTLEIEVDVQVTFAIGS
jgi:uncharacterized protein YggE